VSSTTALEADVFEYLNDLRDSGETNMMGAGPYLESKFGFNRFKAKEWLFKWMEHLESEDD